jgi:hypothetical protein
VSFSINLLPEFHLLMGIIRSRFSSRFSDNFCMSDLDLTTSTSANGEKCYLLHSCLKIYSGHVKYNSHLIVSWAMVALICAESCCDSIQVPITNF